MDAVQRYGWKDVKSIAQHVGTRTPTQVRTHAQKLFLRQQKEQTGARLRLPELPPRSTSERFASEPGFAFAGIMQPVKNGRTDMPPGVALLEGPGGSSGASDGQLQVRPPRCAHHAAAPALPYAREPSSPRLLATANRLWWVRAGAARGGLSGADARPGGVWRLGWHVDRAGRDHGGDGTARDADGRGPVGHCQLEQPRRRSEVGQYEEL